MTLNEILNRLNVDIQAEQDTKRFYHLKTYYDDLKLLKYDIEQALDALDFNEYADGLLVTSSNQEGDLKLRFISKDGFMDLKNYLEKRICEK